MRFATSHLVALGVALHSAVAVALPKEGPTLQGTDSQEAAETLFASRQHWTPETVLMVQRSVAPESASMTIIVPEVTPSPKFPELERKIKETQDLLECPVNGMGCVDGACLDYCDAVGLRDFLKQYPEVEPNDLKEIVDVWKAELTAEEIRYLGKWTGIFVGAAGH